MNFDPGGFVVQKLIGMMPEELKKKLLQLRVIKAHADSLGSMPSQLESINKMGSMYSGLGVKPSERPLGSN